MKRSTALLLIMAALLTVCFVLPAPAKAESAINIPLSVSYNSTYWWRGVELNGKGAGVLWLGAGLEIAGTGLTFYVYSATPEDYLIQSDVSTPDRQANRDYQKSIWEFDYGFSYEKTLEDTVTLGASLYYVHYPFYDELDPDAINTSFIEASVSAAVKTILTPKLTLFYDYFLEESAAKTPVDEDYYVQFSVSQALIDAQGFAFTVGGWVGYYNNAYYELKGWSDAGVTVGYVYTLGNSTFGANFNYARSLTEDFQTVYMRTGSEPVNGSVGILKNHMWLEFEVTHKI
ncbi:MAG TPA: hypothetical protein PKY31_17010 [Spirochaetota bacterium]|nr:hypothetical protein [Spirochaetota bacterium]